MTETLTTSLTTSPASFAYDDDSLLTCASPTTCSPVGTGAVTFTRARNDGQVTAATAGVLSETTTYSSYGELARHTVTAGATPLYQLTVHETAAPRDKLGRITRKTELVQGTTTVEQYAYDVQGRLSDVTTDGVLAEHYEYDSNGNRLSLTTPTETLVGTYDDQDRLLTYGPYTYAYTANGELVSKTNTTTAEVTGYTYDVLGNLVGVTLPTGDVIEYVWDGRGRRVGKKKNGLLVQQLLYRDELKPVAELDGAGNLVARYVYGSKANVPDLVLRDGKTYRVISDQLGSPVLAVNVVDAADVAMNVVYSAFGEVTGTGIGWMALGFAGGLYDAETGLVRFGARDYEPSIGRWVSKDPYRFDAGVNHYAYVGYDPVNSYDWFGLAPSKGQLSACAMCKYVTMAIGSACRTMRNPVCLLGTIPCSVACSFVCQGEDRSILLPPGDTRAQRSSPSTGTEGAGSTPEAAPSGAGGSGP